MTLEQATERARAAAVAGDMAQLREALQARRDAIGEVTDPERLKAAILAGEAIERDLRLFRMKVSIDWNRLTQIRAALLAGHGATDSARLNLRG